MIDFSLSWNNILQNREIPFADLPDQGPVISGSQPRYHTGDILAANCSSSRSLPAASLKWANSTLTQIWLQIFFSPWHWININPEAYKVRWLEDFFPSNCFAVKLHQPSLAAQLWLTVAIKPIRKFTFSLFIYVLYMFSLTGGTLMVKRRPRGCWLNIQRSHSRKDSIVLSWDSGQSIFSVLLSFSPSLGMSSSSPPQCSNWSGCHQQPFRVGGKMGNHKSPTFHKLSRKFRLITLLKSLSSVSSC